MNIIRIVLIISVLGMTLPHTHAQKHVTPSEADVKEAKKIKAIHEDDQLAAINSSNVYTFEYDAKKDKVIVIEKEQEELIALESSINYTPSIFYDEMSFVQNVTAKHDNDKKVDIQTKDEYYNISDYFYSDARVVFYRLNFPTTGSKYSLSHIKQTNDIKYFTSSYFHSIFPIQKKTLQFHIPDWLDIELKEMNFEGYDISKTSSIDNKKNTTIHTFEIKDIESMSRVRGAPGNSHTYPHVLVLSKSYTINGKQKMLFNSAKDLYDWYKSLVSSMDDQPDLLQEKVTELTASADTDIDKVKAIYYWVQDNIRYIAFEDGIAGFQPDDCQNVYKNKYGDCKGMANLTKQMLNLAGYDARLTWIGTKRIAYDYSLPTMAVDNHMICTVILDGKQYFLDPTEKFGSLSEYAGRIEGKQVMIEDGDNFILSSVPQMKPEDNAKIIINQLSIEDDNLVGNVKRKYKGESKAYILYRIHNEESHELEDALNYFITQKDKNIQISNLETSDFDNRDDELTMDYELTQKNSVSSFGEEIYLDIDFYKEYSNYDFEDRKVGYMFPHKSDISIKTELEIPSGYSIQDIPSRFEKENDIYSFNMGYKKNGNKLIYEKRIIIKKDKLPKKSLADWNTTIKELNDFYEEQVVLKKN